MTSKQAVRKAHEPNEFEQRRLAKVDREYYRAINQSNSGEDEGYDRIVEQQLADIPQRNDL